MIMMNPVLKADNFEKFFKINFFLFTLDTQPEPKQPSFTLYT